MRFSIVTPSFKQLDYLECCIASVADQKGVVLSWAKSSGLEVEKYLEGDPWLYWLQPIYTHDAGAWHIVAQGISLGLGLVARLSGPRGWAILGRIYGTLTGSLPTQAAFILKKR